MARDIFNELVTGLNELKLYQQGKIILKTKTLSAEDKAALDIKPKCGMDKPKPHFAHQFLKPMPLLIK